MLKEGDSVYCIEDLNYTFKGKECVVKSGHTLLIRGMLGDSYILDRFGKPFIVNKEKIKLKN